MRSYCLGLVLVLVLLCPRVGWGRPTNCDTGWLSRSDQTFDLPGLARVCGRKDTLLSANFVVCKDGGAADKYKKAFESVCAVKPEDAKREDVLALYTLYMANGDLLGLATTSAGAAAPTPAAGAAEPKSVEAEGVVGSPIAGVVAQGLANFLVSRAEAEVALFATDAFFSELCEKNEARDYFTTTCNLMKNPDNGKYGTDPPSLGTLRNALIRDLRALPSVVVNQLAASANPNTKRLGCALDVGYAMAQGLRANE